MSFNMKIDTSEVMAWVNNSPNRERAKRQALMLMRNLLVKEVISEIEEHNGTGELKRSVMGTSDNKKIEIKSNMYGDIVLEYGRKPGRMPPIEPLRSWVERKFGTDHNSSYPIARQIAINIAQRGTKKFQQKGPKQISQIEKKFNDEIIPRKMETLLNEYTK